jgi:hypothetical protein
MMLDTPPVTPDEQPVWLMRCRHLADCRDDRLTLHHYVRAGIFAVLHSTARHGANERFSDLSSAMARFDELRMIIGHMGPVQYPS